jgi:hypothetical protein
LPTFFIDMSSWPIIWGWAHSEYRTVSPERLRDSIRKCSEAALTRLSPNHSHSDYRTVSPSKTMLVYFELIQAGLADD